MNKILIFFIISFFLTTSCYGQKKEEKLVRETFENYKYALLNDKGEDAAKIVDSRTIKYYSDLQELVRNADSFQVESLSLLDKYIVFSIRHRATKTEILSFGQNGLLVYSINSGMVSKNSVVNSSVGEVTVDRDFAKGQILANGKKAPFYFNFYKEEGHWKINLTSLYSMSTMAFKKMVDDSGQTENEFLFTLLELMNGKKPGAEIWEKVK